MHRNQTLAFLICVCVCVFQREPGLGGAQEVGHKALAGGRWRGAEAGNQARHQGLFPFFFMY